MELLGISIISDISDTQSDIVMEELKGNEIPDRRSGEKHEKQLSNRKRDSSLVAGGRVHFVFPTLNTLSLRPIWNLTLPRQMILWLAIYRR